MKILSTAIAVCIMLFFQHATAQKNAVATPEIPVNAETKLITYTKVVDVPEVSKPDLFKRALNWGNTYYKNPADVIREKDEASGIIICKHRFKITNPYDKKAGLATDAGLIQYTLTLDFKDGKYRYTLTEYNLKGQSYFACEKWMDKTNKLYSPNWDYYLQQLDENTKQIIGDFEKALLVAPTEKKKDW